MALQVYGTNSIGTGIRANLTDTDDVLIASDATVGSTDSIGVYGHGNFHVVDVQGTVAGENHAIWVGNTLSDYGQRVTIGENGYVLSGAALSAAVLIYGNDSKLDNAGTIRGDGGGVLIGGSNFGDTSLITNSGLIEAIGTSAIQRLNGATDIIEVHNSGEIRSVANAFHSSTPAIDRIFNSGLIVGDVRLGDGGDEVDNTGGRIDGQVAGESGADEMLGGAFEDRFSGGDGADQLAGGGGDDDLSGDMGNDIMFGGAGNDYLFGGADVDQLEGDDGDDTIDGFTGNDILSGGAGDDRLFGFHDADQIDGGAGNDTADGGTGNDIMSGGAGNDALFGFGDVDQIDGGADNDTLDGGAGGDTMSGGAGNDTFAVESAGDIVSEVAGSGIDLVSSLISFDFSDAVHAKGALENLTLTGNAVTDGTGNALANKISGNLAANVLKGMAGNDALFGQAGADKIDGGAGNDRVDGGAGGDTMSGGAGNDTFFVESAADVVSEVGGSGIDLVSSLISFNLSNAARARGALEKLTLTGIAATNGAGNALANAITGNVAANSLSGLAGNDTLVGGAGGDRLLGGLGNDVLRGQDGLDRLHGGAGKDTLIGGANADIFVFDSKPSTSANRDIVTDFVHGQDKLWLENAVFAKVGPAGVLKAGAFHAGTAAHDADDRIVYNKATGVVSYDADGNGTLPAVQFGLLANKAVLTASDFVVV